jgi:CRP-like cAMP-binding protein
MRENSNKNIINFSPEEIQIKNLSNTIKEQINNEILIENLMKSQETISLINYIVSKTTKNSNDILILNTFLKQKENFMNLFKIDNEFDINLLLTKISSNLKLKTLNKNSFVFHVGEEGNLFYIILKGKVSILIPKQIKIHMSFEQYKFHLQLLCSLNEKFLYEETHKLNKKIYNLNEKDLHIIKNKKILNFNFITNNLTLDEYLNYSNGLKSTDNSSEFYNELKIMGYFKVVTLKEGNSFGEVALINENQKRTASIFCETNAIFGVLSSNEYKNSIKSIQIKIKKNNIDFILNTNIFKDISYKHFYQKIWNYFIYGYLKKDEFLFKENDKRNFIYIIFEGELKLSSKMDIAKINEIIIKLGKFKKPGFHIYKSNSIEIILNIIKKGDILGVITIDEKHFCDCVCTSKFCSYFAIDFNVVENLMKKYEGIRKKLDEIKINRKKIIIDRLKNVKKVYKKTIFGEFRDNFINKIEVGYKKKIDVKNLFYDEIENKIKRIKSNKNFFLKNVNVNINKFNEVFNNNKSRNVKNFNFNTNSDIFKSKNYLSPFSTNYSIFSNNSKKIINKKTQIFYNKILTTSNENNKSSFENKFFKTEKKIIKNLKRNASDFNNEEKQKKYLNKINNYFYNKNNNNNNKINFIDFLIFEKQKEKLTKSNKNIQKKRPFSSDFNKIPINFLINAKMKIIKKNIQKN